MFLEKYKINIRTNNVIYEVYHVLLNWDLKRFFINF